MKTTGHWYPAGSSKKHKAIMQLQDGGFVLESEGIKSQVGRFDELNISSRIGNIPRRVTLENDSIFESRDNDVFDQWISQNAGISSGVLHNLESKWRWIVPSIILVVGLGFSGFKWGLPWLSYSLAQKIPQSVVQRISDSTMAAMDELFFEQSELSEARQHELTVRFNNIVQYQGVAQKNHSKFVLSFRKLGVPNAFALPSGEIVISDELVSVTKNPLQLDSVLLHEISHVEFHHGMQQVIRSSIVAVIVAMIAGDPSGLEELFVGLPVFLLQSQYSRDHEIEADLYALERMMQNNIDPIHFAEALKKIVPPNPEQNTSNSDGKTTKHSVFDYFSTHPGTLDRINTALSYSEKYNKSRIKD